MRNPIESVLLRPIEPGGPGVGPLVAAVIPAFNAAATIGETLSSVSRQSHRNLEIIVVDDGSSDATADIVRAHAERDSRVRLIRQSNGGVALARNAGIEAARAELVAPVDADDLWHPQKIARQVAALQAGGPQVGLVYTWSMLIDEAGHIIGPGHRSHAQGDVRRQLCREIGMVGNGSAALMRKSAVLQAGGYDPGLRNRQAQGCEDFKLYFAIALRHHFALVPETLTGYRQARGSMSHDTLQMARSWQIVCSEIRERHPDLTRDLDKGSSGLLSWLYRRARKAGRSGDAARLAARLLPLDPRGGLGVMLFRPMKRRISSTFAGRPPDRLAVRAERFLPDSDPAEPSESDTTVDSGAIAGAVAAIGP